METYIPLVLRFIRKSSKNTDDDTMIITPKWKTLDNEVSVRDFEVKMEFAQVGLSPFTPKSTVTSMLSCELVQYVKSMCMLLTFDEDPFESLQVDAGNLPSVLLSVSNLDETLEHLESYLKIATRSWPTAVKSSTGKRNVTYGSVTYDPVAPSVPVRRHIIFE